MRSVTAARTLAAVSGLVTACSGANKEVPMGAPVPEFALQGSDGKVHRLSDHKGQRAVVIAWYPVAHTGG
jgi:hypothetical protein